MVKEDILFCREFYTYFNVIYIEKVSYLDNIIQAILGYFFKNLMI